MRLLLIGTVLQSNIDEVLMVTGDTYQVQDVLNEATTVLQCQPDETTILIDIHIPDDTVPGRHHFSEYRPYLG